MKLDFIFIVFEEGIEPSVPFLAQALNLLCLPISPLEHSVTRVGLDTNFRSLIHGIVSQDTSLGSIVEPPTNVPARSGSMSFYTAAPHATSCYRTAFPDSGGIPLRYELASSSPRIGSLEVQRCCKSGSAEI